MMFTLGTDIWAQLGMRKVGMLGNILVKSHIQKLKFDVFEIRRSYSLNINNVKKIQVRVWVECVTIG